MARRFLSFIFALGMAATGLWLLLAPFLFSTEIQGPWFTGSIILVAVGFGWLYGEFLKPVLVRNKLRDELERHD